MSIKLIFKSSQLLGLLLLLFSCESEAPSANKAQSLLPQPSASFQLSYQLDKPDTFFLLKNDLVEISGLSMDASNDKLLAINDEEGIIFYLNYETGQVEKQVKFGKMNDYEGIETVGEKVYVTKSNGTIYEITDLRRPLQLTETYPTFLKTINDVEGLAYDARSNSLLLACKGKAGEGEAFKKSRAIYTFNLNQKELSPEPFLLIKREAVAAFFNKEKSKNPLAAYWQDFTIEQLSKAFAPSGIAIHPKTGNLYLLSSSGKMLLILGKNKEILHLVKLDASLMRQPEGICFHPDGRLFISSEGDGARGRLLVFSPRS